VRTPCPFLVSSPAALRLAALVSLILCIGACGDGSGPGDETNIARVTVSPVAPGESGLLVGATRQLRVILLDSMGLELPPRPATWHSSDDAVATVSADGLVAGVTPGGATITATVGSMSGSHFIPVLPLAASLEILPNRIGLVPGGAYVMKVVYRNESGGELSTDGRPVTWTVADPGVATLTGGAEPAVFGTAPGSTTFTAAGAGAEGTAAVDVATVQFATIYAGAGHSCGTTPAQIAWCWGSNVQNLLASPVGGTTFAPLRTEGLDAVAQIATDEGHACARTTPGEVWCWGSPAYGALGDGAESPVFTFPSPRKVVGGLTFTDLAVGAAHTCGLAGGHAWCWGYGAEGQIGNGGAAIVNAVPTEASGGRTYASIRSNALAHRTCALETGGQAWCWGAGPVGDGDPGPRLVPTAVAGGLAFTAITVGGRHACGLTSDGKAWCWGDNDQGQLGQSGTHLAPGPVDGGLTFSSLTAGEVSTCGIATTGAGWCWGANADGQLGDGSSTSTSAPVQVSGGLTFSQLSAGAKHTCGLTQAQVAYCWGSGDAVGSETNGARLVPTKVMGQP
jgi:alpha-tubulin suppressor-like RCC1 family protein